MNHHQLFQRLLLDLQCLINSENEFETIRSSLVLRQLLLDGDALMILVNREIRASSEFLVRQPPELSDNVLYPCIFPGISTEQAISLNLGKFLAHIIGISSGREITIKEVIKYGAIILGGVHFRMDESGEYAHISAIHSSRPAGEQSPVLLALKHIGAVVRDALVPLRDKLLVRERFEKGVGWTAAVSLRLLPVPPDEENYIFDIGASFDLNRFSVYVDTRNELTFRIIDGNGVRRYLRAGTIGPTDPPGLPMTILCELSTVGEETLLSIRTDNWNHAEIVIGATLESVGLPFHYVTGSDCMGRKHTHMDQFRSFLIAQPLTGLELGLVVAWLTEGVTQAESWVRFSDNQFLYSVGHPNFIVDGTESTEQTSLA